MARITHSGDTTHPNVESTGRQQQLIPREKVAEASQKKTRQTPLEKRESKEKSWIAQAPNRHEAISPAKIALASYVSGVKKSGTGQIINYVTGKANTNEKKSILKSIYEEYRKNFQKQNVAGFAGNVMTDLSSVFTIKAGASLFKNGVKPLLAQSEKAVINIYSSSNLINGLTNLNRNVKGSISKTPKTSGLAPKNLPSSPTESFPYDRVKLRLPDSSEVSMLKPFVRREAVGALKVSSLSKHLDEQDTAIDSFSKASFKNGVKLSATISSNSDEKIPLKLGSSDQRNSQSGDSSKSPSESSNLPTSSPQGGGGGDKIDGQSEGVVRQKKVIPPIKSRSEPKREIIVSPYGSAMEHIQYKHQAVGEIEPDINGQLPNQFSSKYYSDGLVNLIKSGEKHPLEPSLSGNGTYVRRWDTGETIGYDPNTGDEITGTSLRRLMVVTNPEGKLITAYPIY
jgi:hypothetical protein